MSKQIQIRWNQDMGANYDESVAALAKYDPRPDTTASVRIKGAMTPAAVRQFVKLASKKGLDVGVTLTATWPDEVDVAQLRLFPPPGVDSVATVEGETTAGGGVSETVAGEIAEIVGNARSVDEAGRLVDESTGEIIGEPGPEDPGDHDGDGEQADEDDEDTTAAAA